MIQLFLDRIENPISVINLNLSEVILNAFGKPNFEHLHTFAYAGDRRQTPWAGPSTEALNPRQNNVGIRLIAWWLWDRVFKDLDGTRIQHSFSEFPSENPIPERD